MVITLTTDFGYGSSYVAAMKGVILGINQAAAMVDLSHNIPPQDVRHAAFLLAESSSWFPAGTIHVAVVDPGVGTDRAILYVESGDQRYLAPDNGMLSLIAQQQRLSKIVRLEATEYWRADVSATFHGRDIFAPVAARLSLGLDPDKLGPQVTEIVKLNWPKPSVTTGRISGEVQSIDRYGNLITNIRAEHLNNLDWTNVTVECEGRALRDVVRTYGERPPGTPVALIGSSGYLEISVVNGNAARYFAAQVGSHVSVAWPHA